MEDESRIEKARLLFSPGKPMQLEATGTETPENVPQDQKALLDSACLTIKAYIKATHELLEKKFPHIKECTPNHLQKPVTVVCLCCPNGIIVRYDIRNEEKSLVVGAWVNETLFELALKISESVVYCHADKDFKSLVPDKGPEIALSVAEPTSGKQRVIFHARIGLHCVIQPPSGDLPKPPAKPYCIMSVTNSFELALTGVMLSTEDSTKKPQKFLLRQPMRIPVGWECIEIFPYPSVIQWKPEYAAIWAERDLLASVVSNQYKKQQLLDLDPKATARAELTKLLKAYKQLLDSEPEREEALQSFLKENPSLLCPAYTMMKPKLSFGKRITDFVFREVTGDYLLVELKLSSAHLFTKSGSTSYQLKEARNQIIDWRRYIEDNIGTVQRELGLTGISSNPQALIVIGRSSSLSEENKRKLVTLENESPKTKIITYDGVFDNAKTIIENLLGPLWIEGPTPEIYYLPD